MKKDHRMVSLHVPFYLYDELTKYLDEVRCNRHVSDLVGMAIADWLAQARKRSAESLEQRAQGYLWKRVFPACRHAIKDGRPGSHRLRSRT